MDFGKPLRKRKSEIKYGAFYCSEIQLQRLMADKLSCFYSKLDAEADLQQNTPGHAHFHRLDS